MRGSGRRERQRGREGEGGKGREEGERELIRNDTPHGRESARGGSDRQMDTERGGERDTHRERERQGGLVLDTNTVLNAGCSTWCNSQQPRW